MRILTAALVCLALLASVGHADVKSFFPTMDGWEPEGEPGIYQADNLYEYIDGSADLYLMYNFKELGTLNYFDNQGRGLTIDIYEHGSDASAFGIYSQERPTPMNAMEIGAQAYYDYGILNFCQGPYYVKIMGYDLDEFDQEMLAVVAKIVSVNIGGAKELPKALACFPTEAMVPNSQRYIAKNVFGHSFLRSAFVAQYRSNGNSNSRAFIIEAKDEADAGKMLESYLSYVKENGAAVSDDNGVYRFQDPASRSAGAINLKASGSYIWGISTTSEDMGSAFVAAVEKNLKTEGLLQ